MLDRPARARRGTGFVAGDAVTTVLYIVERKVGFSATNTGTSRLLQVLSVVPLEGTDFQRALALGLADHDDAVQVAACLRIGADCLVTRNARLPRGSDHGAESR